MRTTNIQKNKKLMLLCAVVLLIITGCGRQNTEAVSMCKEEYAKLVDEHNVVIALYADSLTEEYEEPLNRLGQRVKEIGELDAGKMEVAELDSLMAEMGTLMEEYEEIYQKISEIPAEDEETEYCYVSVTLKNMTTLPFYEVYFYNTAKEDTRENIVTEDAGNYDGLEVYNLVNLVMEKSQTVWHLETMDEDGLVIESGDVDLSSYQGGNVVIEMYYSFDTNEGWLEMK